MHRLRTLLATLLVLCAAAPAAAQIAILDSARTREFFRRHYPECSATSPFLGAEEYQRYFRGWEFVLGELGLPYSIVHDPDLTPHGLRSYSVLILSNIVGLSDRQKLAILTWTLGGGRLLATFGTSYRDVTLDRAEADRLRRRRADPLGLQQLWFDFGSKLFSSEAEGPFVDVQIARFTGPTANLGFLPGGRLAYGGHANLLPKLPPQTKQVLGWLLINESVTRYPAIISTASGRGHTVYYAFAPEYLVSKEFEGTPLMPNLPVCADGQTWSGRSEHGRALMRDTVSYLLRLPRRR